MRKKIELIFTEHCFRCIHQKQCSRLTVFVTLDIVQKSLSISFFFVILVHLYQNMYSKIFQTICFNIPCITNISRTKCFNCDRKLYIKTCYDSKSLRIITNCDNYNILTIYKNTHKSKYDQRVCKMFQYSQIVKWLS